MSPELGTYAILAVIGGLYWELRTLRHDVRELRDAMIRAKLINGPAGKATVA